VGCPRFFEGFPAFRVGFTPISSSAGTGAPQLPPPIEVYPMGWALIKNKKIDVN